MSQTSLHATNLQPGKSSLVALGAFVAVVAIGVAYSAFHLIADLEIAPAASIIPYILLGIALLIALGFEFVNGFHDTANAVATVIYTNSLSPNTAVMWSGLWNFLGVLTSTGAVAFGIVSLLPVELILQVGSDAGFAMVFALLIAAVIWNLGTWYFGLPSSSSHTLIGSIIGVGLMNQLMAQNPNGTSGVDWGQALGIGKALVFSPLIGFFAAAALLLLAKALIRIPALYRAPEGKAPPPLWIRALLVLTCTGVSFAHGSNDGQKGMGLIMLILIGTVPTAYALNRAMDPSQTQIFAEASDHAEQTLERVSPSGQAAVPNDPRGAITTYIKHHQLAGDSVPALKLLIADIKRQVTEYGSVSNVPPSQVGNVRNDMYLTSEALRLMIKSDQPHFEPAEVASLNTYKASIDKATKFIPTWVKVAVAIALGLGTMVGWRRIVVTVGEKIGKEHLTYAQGASAEIVAMATIGAADAFGLPVSTTHVLSSGVAGTMAANRSGLQGSTIRNLIMAWVLTLPVSIALSGALFWLLRHIF